MILQSALLVLATSALQAASPEPTKPSVLPADCGVTEEQVLVMTVPKYHELVTRSNRHDPGSSFEDHFDASVVAALRTSLGFAGQSFLIVAVSVQSGSCDACYDATVMAIDLRTKLAAWRSDSRSGECYIAPSTFSESNGPILRVFPLFPDDRVRTLAFRFGSEDPFHGERATDERWLRPSLGANGSLTFETVWEANASFDTSGVASLTWPHEVRSTMRSLWPKRAYRFTRHTSAGWDDQMLSGFPIELITRQEFTEERQTHKLIPGAKTMARYDRRHISLFPFNLRMSALVLDLSLLPDKSNADRPQVALSPGGDLFADRVEGRFGKHQHLRVCRVGDDAQLRDVWSGLGGRGPGSPDIEDGLDFRAVGWAPDGRRCLAIVDLGLYGIPPVVISLTPDGKGDRWEGFLPEGYVLPDGFILDLNEPPGKPANTSPKQQ
jgi:hypothetical protein